LEGLNFVLTNRVPRRTLTRFMGWFSRVEQPLVRDVSIAVWRLFCDVDLSDASKTEFKSLHDCFVRELRPGARPVDRREDVLVSPCDGIVGAAGRVRDGVLLQVKGSSYTLDEFLLDPALAEMYRNGCYVTLRLTAGMYHRFHAPHDGRIEQVTHVPGDTWNVNPAALKRVERLYCRNERAILRLRCARGDHVVTLVAVAAILVAGIRLRFVDLPSGGRGLQPAAIFVDAECAKGSEIGWFEHGSTIIVLAPGGFTLCDGVGDGSVVRMGQPLLRS
jgi:phosphatidylserine decarboxylase